MLPRKILTAHNENGTNSVSEKDNILPARISHLQHQASSLPFMLEVPELQSPVRSARRRSSTISEKERQAGGISRSRGEPLQQVRVLSRRPQRSGDGIGLKCAPIEDNHRLLLLLQEGEVGHRLQGHGRHDVRVRDLGSVVGECRLLLLLH
jgi:hypothetical protein